MKLSRLLIALAVFSVFIQLSSAQIINEIKLNVSGSGLVFVTGDFNLLGNETAVDLSLPIYSNLEISSSGIVIPYTNKSFDGGVRVELDLRNLPSGVRMRDVALRYETQHLTSKNGSIWSVSFATKATPRKTIIKLYLPKNSTILSLSPKDVFFSVDRDSLWLYPQENEFNFTCDYEYAGGPAPPVAEGEGSNLLLTSAFVLIVLAAIAASLYYLLRRRASSKVVGKLEMEREVVSSGEQLVGSGEAKKTGGVGDIEFEFKTESTTPKVKSTVFNVLDDDEKNIISFIQEHGPEDVTQAFIYKTTRVPKSSLSEVIKRLEKRNVLECRREGRVNWIRLKKWVLE